MPSQTQVKKFGTMQACGARPVLHTQFRRSTGVRADRQLLERIQLRVRLEFCRPGVPVADGTIRGRLHVQPTNQRIRFSSALGIPSSGRQRDLHKAVITNRKQQLGNDRQRTKNTERTPNAHQKRIEANASQKKSERSSMGANEPGSTWSGQPGNASARPNGIGDSNRTSLCRAWASPRRTSGRLE